MTDREVRMRKEDRFRKVIEYFQQHRPVAETELEYSNPYQLAVAVILSAQCTDKRVNMITPAFYLRFPDIDSLSRATADEVFGLIKSCSYPNNKAKNLVSMAQVLVSEYNGQLPDDVDELQKIPGIGRKTANVLASVLFGKEVIAVDTHVFRVAERIGLTNRSKNPLQTEMQLVKHIPPALRPIAHHWLILHGRYTCTARKPACETCGLREYCRFYLTKISRQTC